MMSCAGGKTSLPPFDAVQNTDLASVLKLTKDTTAVFLTDFMPTLSVADSVTSESVEILKTKEGWDEFSAVATPGADWLSTIRVWNGGRATDIVAFRNELIPVTVTYKGQAKKVSVVGQMTNWTRDVINLTSEDGQNWSTTFKLPAGKYQYQLAVDEAQILDPANPLKEGNGSGGFNSVLDLQGADKTKAPVISTLASSGRKIELIAANAPSRVVAQWQNVVLPQEMVTVDGDRITVAVPDEASDIDRSYVRIYASNDNGISNDVLVPLASGEVIADAAVLTRQDKHRNILYSLMIDRFENGNPSNDRKLNDPEVLPMADYMGGDLKGVTAKINDGFFNDLGITTIWLSPITQNPYNAWGQNEKPRTKFSGYHGYWPIYITAIDERFGTPDELRELLDAAHAKGLNVILDYVANHMHIDAPTLKAHPDWTTPAKTPDGRDNIGLWDEFRLTTWFDRHIPTLDLERVEVYEPMTDSALYWIANYDFDGFRHDASKHIPEVYWRTLTKKMKERFPDKTLYQVGETYGSPELINSYVKSGMLDAQFDFNVYDAATGAIALPEGSMKALYGTIENSLETYGYHNLMAYITGNHDRPRYISLAGGALSFSEDTKAAGWNRDITVGDSSSYDKLSLLEAVMFTIPGVPTIYQGDEYGVPGGNDPDNRRMMNFAGYNDRETAVKNKVRQLAQLRKDNMALIYGDMMPLYADDNVMVYARNYMGNVALVGINKAPTEQVVTVELPVELDLRNLKPNFGNKVNVDGRKIELSLAPVSFEVAIN